MDTGITQDLDKTDSDSVGFRCGLRLYPNVMPLLLSTDHTLESSSHSSCCLHSCPPTLASLYVDSSMSWESNLFCCVKSLSSIGENACFFLWYSRSSKELEPINFSRSLLQHHTDCNVSIVTRVILGDPSSRKSSQICSTFTLNSAIPQMFLDSSFHVFISYSYIISSFRWKGMFWSPLWSILSRTVLVYIRYLVIVSWAKLNIFKFSTFKSVSASYRQNINMPSDF